MEAERFVTIHINKGTIGSRGNFPRINNLGLDGFEVEVLVSKKDYIIESAIENGVQNVPLRETEDGYAVIRLFNEDKNDPERKGV